MQAALVDSGRSINEFAAQHAHARALTEMAVGDRVAQLSEHSADAPIAGFGQLIDVGRRRLIAGKFQTRQPVATELLIGPAGAGKTAHAVERIQAARRANPLTPVRVILPSQAQVEAFRRRLAAAGGALGVQIGTFYAVYADLLAEAGTHAARLDEPVLYRLLRGAAAALDARGELPFYAAVRDTPGFLRLLLGAIQELKQARLTPEDFAAKVHGMSARLGEIARLYAHYQEQLRANGWVDDEGRGWLAALALERNPALASAWRLLVVDGFDEFNPTQLEVLGKLAQCAPATLVTLTGADTDRLALRRFVRARQQIETALAPERVTRLPAAPHAATALAQMESQLFETTPAPMATDMPGTPPAVAFAPAPTRALEVRAALRWLKARIVREQVAPRDTALLARDIGPYRALIEETASEFGLPVRFMDADNLAGNPAMAALLNLLALPVEDYPHRAVVDAWRSPYFDWRAEGIAPGDADPLDAAACLGQVSGGRAQWREALASLSQAGPDDDEREGDETAAAAPAVSTAANLAGRFDAFCARLTPPAGSAPARVHAAWIENLIGPDPDLPSGPDTDPGLALVSRARENRDTAGRDVAALQAFKDVLRALVFGQQVQPGGPRPMSYAEFWAELRGAVEAAGYHSPPPGHDCITVASTLGARGLSFRAVALVGLAEGEFPRAAAEDPLLTDTDRAQLGVAPRLSGDEVTIFYEAVTRARERLLLTRPDLAGDGQPWEPSPYWTHLRGQIAPHAPLARATDRVEALGDCASPAEWAAQAADGEWRLPAGDSWDAVARQLTAAARGATVLAARLGGAAKGAYEGDLSPLCDALAAAYPPERAWSASRLETYGTCPFCFFTTYALELEPRLAPEAGYDVRQLGQMLHAILEKLFRSHPTADADTLSAALPPIARAVFDDAPYAYGFRPSALWEQQQRELEALLDKSVRELAADSSGWTAHAFELAFGLRDAPPLVIERDGRVVRLRGYIDRVDRRADGALRVIDYKTGSATITEKDLEAGTRLQLPLYALALAPAGVDGSVSAAFYWHLGAAKPSRLRLASADAVATAAETAAQHVARHVAGVHGGQFAPRPPSGGCPAWCPAAVFCWRYQAKRH